MLNPVSLWQAKVLQHFLTWKSIPKNDRVAWLLLFAGLMATAFVSFTIKADIERELWQEFVSDCNEVAARIEARLESHKQVLLGGAALFGASRSVERDEWRDYAKRMQIDRHFNGIEGLGFALLVPQDRLARHIDEIRKQGFPAYGVWPQGEREVYSSIVYLEPFSGRNLRAFGYDMYSEPVRRAAMEQARDADMATLTGKVMLVQESGSDVQAGTLMYMPVYRNGLPLDTIARRRAALVGWVYSPFRMDDLLQGVMQGSGQRDARRLHLEVRDGIGGGDASLLYDSDSSLHDKRLPLRIFQFQRQIDFNGRVWSLHFDMFEDGYSSIDYSRAWATLAAGVALSLLLYLLALSVLFTRRNAQLIANELMAELRRNAAAEHVMNQKLELQGRALDASANAVAILDAEAAVVWANAAFGSMSGCSMDEIVGHRLEDLVLASQPVLGGQIRDALRAGQVWHGEVVNRRKDGTTLQIDMTISPVIDAQGEISHFIVIKQDISERKRAEYALEQSQHRMELALNGGDLGLWDWDVPSGRVIFNQRWCEMLGYTLDEIDPDVASWKNLVHPDDWPLIDAPLLAHMHGDTPSYESEHRMRHKDGHWVWILDRGKIMERNSCNEPIRMVGTHLDISERKRSEALRLQQVAAQRNALVREVHHRIKNNLQGMIGLLGLEAAQHPQAADALGDAIGKIKSIAVVFGLQGLRDENIIYLHEVVLELCKAAHKLTDADIRLQFEGNTPRAMRLDNDKAVAIALIVNELITNAIKHNSGGNVQVSLERLDGHVELRIANRCSGRSAELDWEQGLGLGTGLNLVKVMMPQEGAQLSMTVEQGRMNAVLRLGPPVVSLGGDILP